jgi:hypothetical protein
MRCETDCNSRNLSKHFAGHNGKVRMPICGETGENIGTPDINVVKPIERRGIQSLPPHNDHPSPAN